LREAAASTDVCRGMEVDVFNDERDTDEWFEHRPE
jgi:hypothetical protein